MVSKVGSESPLPTIQLSHLLIRWIAPTDQKALGIGDQFLLGETIIAAPVLTEGAVSRRVYLPAGKWKDGNDVIYTGPTEFTYPAPLATLPYFIKQED